MGGGGATGKVYQLAAAQLSDDGAAIPSYYTTHYFPERAVEQALSLGAHRKLFSYLTMYVEGAGSLALTSFTNSAGVPQAQQALPLSSPAVKDLELPINVLGERVAFRVSTNQSGAWFRLQKFTPSLRVKGDKGSYCQNSSDASYSWLSKGFVAGVRKPESGSMSKLRGTISIGPGR